MDLSEGKMYHTIMYGLNMMGSHASQVSHEERWMIIKYIKSLQAASAEESGGTETEEVETASGESNDGGDLEPPAPAAEEDETESTDDDTE